MLGDCHPLSELPGGASCSPRSSRSLSPAPVPRRSSASTASTLLSRSASDREASSSGGKRGTTIALCPQLSPAQVSLIRKSWRHVNTKGFATILRRVFHRLESSCPCVASSFSSSSNSLSTSPSQVRTVAEHAKVLLRLIQQIVEADQDLEGEILAMGAVHARLHATNGLGTKEFERFGEILVEVMLKIDGIQQSKETSRAWRQLLLRLVEILRSGFDREIRQSRRKSSFNVHSQYFEAVETFRRSSTPSSPRKTSLNIDNGTDCAARKMSDYTSLRDMQM